IWGGFQGDGVKTVLPSHAHAKITCRLVADQDPDVIRDRLTAHVEAHAPPGVRVTVRPLPGSARPYQMPAGHPGTAAARAVLTELYGKPPYHIRTGGSVPVCELFRSVLGVYTVGFGFGLDDEQFHAPNEFFRLSSFERGQKAYCRLLKQIAAA
ncbi:MAG TPA: M20/M25/M40 family metallo-hydrolase, partial [Armatimonadota bacterium]|nr:M20/M25/M40 family metallo-hydrolase [Armatimonadota bacterium]